MKRILLVLVVACLFQNCQPSLPSADLILQNGNIYTADINNPKVEAIAVKAGRIIAVGAKSEILRHKGDSTMVIDLDGKSLYPGFIEGHAHIMGIGANLINVDLMGAQNYDEVIARVKARAAETPEGTWIIGRGWHQDKWDQSPERLFKGFPTHHALSEAVPNHPVYLSHASGHASLANEAAMNMAGIDESTMNPNGGEVFKDVTGQPTGIFNETADELIWRSIPEETEEQRDMQLELAIAECLQNGLTGFHDAGEDLDNLNTIIRFGEEGRLPIRMHVMLSGSDTTLLAERFGTGPQRGLYDGRLNISSVKLYADGALGSRGAWLLEEYSDAKGVHGHNVVPMDEIEEITMRATESGFQVCTHGIGDRANREILDIYEKAFKAFPDITKDHRFRIEHAQHMHPDDLPRFAELGVLPAMQAIHMSSDRPWAIDRLGKKRIEEGAYMWSDLIDNGSKIINGTDAPVEPINPLPSFYASVSRKTLQGKPEGGYEPAQKMTREEALLSYTLWAAYGAFMEDEVGSIEVGKRADFTILDKDIMTIHEEEILNTAVSMTIVDGEVVFEAK
ncbi:MAG: putative amidohydrolase YtcJ [Marinoscillum sp.]|jgi:predicted amidohydrolase YtcJ